MSQFKEIVSICQGKKVLYKKHFDRLSSEDLKNNQSAVIDPYQLSIFENKKEFVIHEVRNDQSGDLTSDFMEAKRILLIRANPKVYKEVEAHEKAWLNSKNILPYLSDFWFETRFNLIFIENFYLRMYLCQDIERSFKIKIQHLPNPIEKDVLNIVRSLESMYWHGYGDWIWDIFIQFHDKVKFDKHCLNTELRKRLRSEVSSIKEREEKNIKIEKMFQSLDGRILEPIGDDIVYLLKVNLEGKEPEITIETEDEIHVTILTQNPHPWKLNPDEIAISCYKEKEKFIKNLLGSGWFIDTNKREGKHTVIWQLNRRSLLNEE